MRRALREELPALRFVYGITGAELERIPFDELAEYREQLPTFLQILAAGRLEV